LIYRIRPGLSEHTLLSAGRPEREATCSNNHMTVRVRDVVCVSMPDVAVTIIV